MTLNIIWFWVLGGMLIAYSVLDGFDFGVGATYLWVAKTNDERRLALNANRARMEWQRSLAAGRRRHAGGLFS